MMRHAVLECASRGQHIRTHESRFISRGLPSQAGPMCDRWSGFRALNGGGVHSVETMMRRVRVVGDCWLWTGSVTGGGYGRVYDPGVPGESVVAHRKMYELVRGPIPHGLTLDHLCRNPACINPDHLEPVTMRENILRGNGPAAINARKTTCNYGHKFTQRPEGRVCMVCKNMRSAARKLADMDAYRAYDREYKRKRRAALADLTAALGEKP